MPEKRSIKDLLSLKERIAYLKVLLLSDSQLAITSAVAQILFNAYSSIKGTYA